MTIAVEVGDGRDLKLNDIVSARRHVGLRAQRQVLIQRMEVSVPVCGDDVARAIAIKIGEHATEQARARIITGDSCAGGIKFQDVADFRFGLILSIKV